MKGSLRLTGLKLLIFTVVTVVVTGYLAAIIGNLSPFARPFEITAQFSDATGLLPGDVVKAAGVTVGRVDGIEVVDGLALVTISIDEDVEIPAGITAEIRYRNLIGQRMISLVPQPSTGRELLAGDATIPLEQTTPAFDLSELFNGLRPLINSTDPREINLVTRELLSALQGRSGDVEQIFSNLADISDVISARDQELNNLLEGLNIVTADLSGRDAQLRRTLANINLFLTELSASRSDLESALVNLDDAATRLGRLVRANDERIRAEVDDLAQVLDAVQDKRADLRAVIRALPDFAIRIERAGSYGEWGNQHLINVCKDDLGECGSRGAP